MPSKTTTLLDHAARIGRAIRYLSERLAAWAAGSGLAGPDTLFHGLYWDDPHTVPVEQLRSRAATTVPAGRALGEALSLPPAEWLTDILLPLKSR